VAFFHAPNIYFIGDTMNIRNNIINYLYDKDYIITMYENSLYIFNYKRLFDFNDTKITVTLDDRTINIYGKSLSIVKMTKEELLINGTISR